MTRVTFKLMSQVVQTAHFLRACICTVGTQGLISCESLAVVQRDLSECSEICMLDFPLIISFFLS